GARGGLAPPAHRHARTRRDHRLVQIVAFGEACETLGRCLRTAPGRGAQLGMVLEIITGAERLVARPGYDCHPQLRVGGEGIKGIRQLLIGHRMQRVVDLGPVDGDDHHAPFGRHLAVTSHGGPFPCRSLRTRRTSGLERAMQTRARRAISRAPACPQPLAGSGPSLTCSLPKFSPRSRPMKARGAFSMPSTISSLNLMRSVRTQSAICRSAAGHLPAKSETMKPRIATRRPTNSPSRRGPISAAGALYCEIDPHRATRAKGLRLRKTASLTAPPTLSK